MGHWHAICCANHSELLLALPNLSPFTRTRATVHTHTHKQVIWPGLDAGDVTGLM